MTRHEDILKHLQAKGLHAFADKNLERIIWDRMNNEIDGMFTLLAQQFFAVLAEQTLELSREQKLADGKIVKIGPAESLGFALVHKHLATLYVKIFTLPSALEMVGTMAAKSNTQLTILVEHLRDRQVIDAALAASLLPGSPEPAPPKGKP